MQRNLKAEKKNLLLLQAAAVKCWQMAHELLLLLIDMANFDRLRLTTKCCEKTNPDSNSWLQLGVQTPSNNPVVLKAWTGPLGLLLYNFPATCYSNNISQGF